LEQIRSSEDPAFLIGVFRTGSEAECSAAADRFESLPVAKFEHLVNGLKDGNESVRRWSAISIGRTQDPFFPPQIVDLLKDGSGSVRETAFDVLKDMVTSGKLVELISAEIRRPNSIETRRRLASYAARARTEYGMLRAGMDENEVARLRTDSHVIVRTARRGKRNALQPAPARRMLS
jgi:HEAT repeat protein